MQYILGVRFNEVGKIYYFKYENQDISKGDLVIAQIKKGIFCGNVVYIKQNFSSEIKTNPSEKIIRKATQKDIDSLENKKIAEDKAKKICKKKILEHKLKMKIVGVEYTFDKSKLIFYFIAESRVDFRSLVKDLAYCFRVRIELCQIGSRDEAKMLGGIGICGKSLCCSTFLNDFHAVSVKMAKDQQMSLNPSKLSGVCGRLKCCLKYEQETYIELIEKMPEIGTFVQTKEGIGKVISILPLSSTIKVQIEDNQQNFRIFNFNIEEVVPI